ncbi:MAG: NifB/NifX family molybdenum-iron cluster-binding protein [Syntrophaceae bacterium]
MRVAIATDGEFVAAHFGRCPAFTLIDIEGNTITAREVIDNPGHQPGVIPQFLYDRGVRCIITGGMGSRAVEMFSELDMEAIAGIEGKVTEIIDKLIKGALVGGESLCQPGAGKGYGVEKSICDHPHEDKCEH